MARKIPIAPLAMRNSEVTRFERSRRTTATGTARVAAMAIDSAGELASPAVAASTGTTTAVVATGVVGDESGGRVEPSAPGSGAGLSDVVRGGRNGRSRARGGRACGVGVGRTGSIIGVSVGRDRRLESDRNKRDDRWRYIGDEHDRLRTQVTLLPGRRLLAHGRPDCTWLRPMVHRSAYRPRWPALAGAFRPSIKAGRLLRLGPG